MAAKDSMNAEGSITLALNALVWTLGDPARADRLLALTGLDPHDLRAHADDRATLSAVLGFLAGHEPDLVACAADLHVSPESLIQAQERLSA